MNNLSTNDLLYAVSLFTFYIQISSHTITHHLNSIIFSSQILESRLTQRGVYQRNCFFSIHLWVLQNLTLQLYLGGIPAVFR